MDWAQKAENMGVVVGCCERGTEPSGCTTISAEQTPH
jgi:hypothetical protein